MTWFLDQVEFQVIHGDTGDGFVALDDIILKHKEECPFTPEAARPAPPTTTMSTPVPTEPPGRKKLIIIVKILLERRFLL